MTVDRRREREDGKSFNELHEDFKSKIKTFIPGDVDAKHKPPSLPYGLLVVSDSKQSSLPDLNLADIQQQAERLIARHRKRCRAWSVFAGCLGVALIGGSVGAVAAFDPSLLTADAALYSGVAVLSAIIVLSIIIAVYARKTANYAREIESDVDKLHGLPQVGTLCLGKSNSGELADDASVVVYAPEWVKAEWEKLAKDYFVGKSYSVVAGAHEEVDKIRLADGNTPVKITSAFSVSDPATLRDLLCLAQSDPKNVAGGICYEKFPGVPPEAVRAMISLASLCVVGAKDQAEYQGGFGCGRQELEPPRDTFIGAYAYPQFQVPEEDTARLFLYKDKNSDSKADSKSLELEPVVSSPEDQQIAERFKPESQKTDASETADHRFRMRIPPSILQQSAHALKRSAEGESSGTLPDKYYYFDAGSYQNYMEELFKTYALAMVDQAKQGDDDKQKLNLKFLNGGTGAFLGSAEFAEGSADPGDQKHCIQGKTLLSIYMLKALNELIPTLAKQADFKKHVGQIELPFFEPPKATPTSDTGSVEDSYRTQWREEIEKLKAVCKTAGISCVFNNNDVLAAPATASTKESKPALINAVGNAGDPQAQPGNEGGLRNGRFSSLDPAVITALHKQGKNLSPHCNTKMQEKVITPACKCVAAAESGRPLALERK